MEFVTQTELKAALIHACDLIVESEPMLTEIDTIIGDGDHGTGMKAGFSELRKYLAGKDFSSPYELMRESGIELVKIMGGASGVIFGTLFIGGHDAIEGKEKISADDLIGFFNESAETISRRGRSKPGDKTMLDALVAAVEAMREARANTGDIRDILAAGHKGALKGVEDTKSMAPRLGRSKNFREQAIGYPDPGAVSVSIIFRGLYEGINK